MRFSLSVLVCVVAIGASVAPASAAVVISNAATQNMNCVPGWCVPTAPDAVLNVADLENMLASGDAKVSTSDENGVQARDIRVSAPVNWSASTTLTLDAFHSIEIDRKVAVSGTGGVSLITNDGGSGGEFACNDHGGITFANLSSALTINGYSYTLVNSVASLARAIAANPSGAYALAKSYNARRDGIYAVPPIPTVFSGSFNGLGNAVSNLSINDLAENAYVGLLAETATGSAISNIRLVNENVQGGPGTSTSSTEYVGGLVGYGAGGSIAHAFTSGTAIGGDYALVGGVVGFATASITASTSSTLVSDGNQGYAGGLAGGTYSASISDSSGTGSISGSGSVGGLVGFNFLSPISHSWATGSVAGVDTSTYAGGLIGANVSSAVQRSFATGTVNCQSVCGGLVGIQQGSYNGQDQYPTVIESFATGSVTASVAANTEAGGLVGFNLTGEISNSYASGAVSAYSAGGLAGENVNGVPNNAISCSYATGAVTGGTGTAGGLIGYDDYFNSSTLKRTFWDMTTSGITDPSQGAGNVPNDPGITGLTDAQLTAGLPKGFNARIWEQNSTINGGLPYLINNPPAN